MTMNITPEQLQRILEAALMVAGRPLPIAHMQKLFDETEQPTSEEIQTALQALRERHQVSGIELHEVASGFQFQAKTELSPWLSRLWEERPPRYSRALLETLALIAYRQPITRAEIEEIRGVTVSSHITKTLLEREWIRVIGYREVVGKPALYGTTKAFLDHFNLKSLDELPTLAELKDLDLQEAKLQVQLELPQSMKESPVDEEHSAQKTEHTDTNESSLSETASDEANSPIDEEHSATETELTDNDESSPTESELDETESSLDEEHAVEIELAGTDESSPAETVLDETESQLDEELSSAETEIEETDSIPNTEHADSEASQFESPQETSSSHTSEYNHEEFEQSEEDMERISKESTETR